MNGHLWIVYWQKSSARKFSPLVLAKWKWRSRCKCKKIISIRWGWVKAIRPSSLWLGHKWLSRFRKNNKHIRSPAARPSIDFLPFWNIFRLGDRSVLFTQFYVFRWLGDKHLVLVFYSTWPFQNAACIRSRFCCWRTHSWWKQWECVCVCVC